MVFSLLFVFIAERPVIRMDDVYLQGAVRKPPLTEIRGSKLNEKVEEIALRNLIALEKRILEPLSISDFRLRERPKN